MPPLLGGRNTTYVGLRPGYSGLLAILLNLSLLATVEAVRIGCERGVHGGWCSGERASSCVEGVYMRDHSSKWTSLTEKLKSPSWTRAGDILVENQDLENYG